MIQIMHLFSKSILFLLGFMTFFLLAEEHAKANTDTRIDDLQPNEYESERDQKDTNLLKESRTSSRSDALSAEKREITFDGSKVNNFDEWKDLLFTNEIETKKSIISQAEKLQLFTSNEVDRQYRMDTSEQDGASMQSMAVLITILAVFCLLLLILVLVVFFRSNRKTSPNKNGLS